MTDAPPSDGDAAGNWEVLESRRMLHDRWIDVHGDKCRTVRGHIIDPYYTLTYPDWAQIVAITDDDELVLVQQYRHGAQRVTLELPAGALDPGDTDPLVAAKRELSEETGFDAREWRLVSSLSPNTATHRNRCHTILALGAYQARPPHQEDGEDITTRVMPLAEVLAGLPKGIIPQALHVSALVLALSAAGRLDLMQAAGQSGHSAIAAS